MSSKLNKLEIVVHFKQVYSTLTGYFIFPDSPLTDCINWILDVLSFNWFFHFLTPLYSHITSTIVFPGLGIYMTVMRIVFIVGVIWSAWFCYGELWGDGYRFLMDYGGEWPKVSYDNTPTRKFHFNLL